MYRILVILILVRFSFCEFPLPAIYMRPAADLSIHSGLSGPVT